MVAPCIAQAGMSSLGGAGGLPVESPFVVPGVQVLVGGEGLREVDAVRQSSPAAVAARLGSRSRFEGLGSEQALQVAVRVFSGLLDSPDGGGVGPPGGAAITGFESSTVARVALAGGVHGLVVSRWPMAMRRPSGAWAPIDLDLKASGETLRPAASPVSAVIPRQLQDGAILPSLGVSITPVAPSGVALSGGAIVTGASAFYANTEVDADTVLKASPVGLDETTLLRGVESPEQLRFRVSAPRGARLEERRDGEGVSLVEGTRVLGVFPTPVASDAAGSPVPVRMSVSGMTLVVSVEHRQGSYLYPIAVDPEFQTVVEAKTGSYGREDENWHSAQAGGYSFSTAGEGMSMTHKGTWPAKDYGSLEYETKGYTKIYAIEGNPHVFPKTETWLEGSLFIGGEGETEHELAFGSDAGEDDLILYANSGDHNADGVANHNWAGMEVTTGVPSSELPKGEQELEFGGSASWMKVDIAQERGKHTEASNNTSSAELEWEIEGKHEKQPNALAGSETWLSPEQGAVELSADDGGLGVSEMEWEYKEGTQEWTRSRHLGRERYLGTSSCDGIQCHTTESQTYDYNTFATEGGALPEGEVDIRPVGVSAMPGSEGIGTEDILKIEAKAPERIVLSGLNDETRTGLSPLYLLGEVEAHVKVEATDGSGSTPSSGMRSIALAVDGRELGTAGGSCKPGPCTASHEWAINGAELGAGRFTLEVIATDRAGMQRKMTYELEVSRASPVAMGPGSVNPESGDFALEATDTALSSPMGSLAVTRHYDSLNTSEGGKEGPIGPQWSLGLGSLAQLEVLPDGSVMVIGPEGLTHFPVKEGGGFEAPEGDSNLKLEHVGENYVVSDTTQGTTTEFKSYPASPSVFYPVVSQGPVATDTTTDEYETIQAHTPGIGVVVPTIELAPHPTASCSHAALEKLESSTKGCRALEFHYDTTNTENEDETPWGEYKSRLKEVVAVAYSPAAGKMVAVPVVHYLYDSQGRLRAVWNPSIKPSLRTIYGYDGEGHVVSVTPPGQSSWAFTYGTIPGDPATGRLVKAYRSDTVWSGQPVSDKEAPQLSGGALLGNTMSVSNGTWSGSPIAYAYQWEECKGENEGCVAILGATNPSFTPTLTQWDKHLRAVVTAINADGAASAYSASSEQVEKVRIPTYTSSVSSWEEGGSGKSFSEPMASAVGSAGDVFVLDRKVRTIDEFSPEGTHIRSFSVQGLEPQSVTVDPQNHVWVSDDSTEHPAVEEYSETGELLKTIAAPKTPGTATVPAGIAADGSGHIWLADSGRAKVVEFNAEEGKVAEEFASGIFPSRIAVDDSGHVFVLGAKAAKGENNVIKEFTDTGTEVREFSGPGTGKLDSGSAIALDADDDVWITDPTAGKVYVYTETGEGLATFGSKGTGAGQLEDPTSITVSGTGPVWVTDAHNLVLQKWTQANIAKAPAIAPQPGSTVDYEVPLEGESAPDQLGVNPQTGKPEPETWGQTDDPVYATAIFPASEPQSWPSSGYKQATILYMDSQARTVNTANPAKGISTQEYNKENEPTRNLTPEDRAAALKEANPRTAAELLDTKDIYDSQGQLTESWGPQHTVRLAEGKSEANERTLARAHTINYYDEGAKAVEEAKKEPYDLITKTVTGAETPSKEEFDPRTTVTSYSGQSNLGWTLRKPTSVTVNPGGLNLTSTARYEASTGAVIETQSPGATDGPMPPAYSTSIGKSGKTEEKLKAPRAVALTSAANIDVLDSSNATVKEFSASGGYLASFSSSGNGNGELKAPLAMAEDTKGNLWVADSGNNRVEEFNSKNEYASQFGKEGEAEGDLKQPAGIAISPKTGDVFVSDYGNNRIQKFGPEGSFIAAIGFGVANGEDKLEMCTSKCRAGLAGDGTGQLDGPRGIAISSHGEVWVADSANSRLIQYNEEGGYAGSLGSSGAGNGQFSAPSGLALDSSGHLWVTDSTLDRVQEFSTSPGRGPEYLTQFGTKGAGNGQFEEPAGIATTSSGTVYVADTGNSRVQSWVPTLTGSTQAYDTKTVYYTPKSEAETTACQGRPEFAGLPCQTTPVAQPFVATPELPTTTITYNVWNQPETTIEAVGPDTRTKHTTFDEAGQPRTTEETAINEEKKEPIDQALPTVTNTYNTTNGTLEKQSTTVGETTETSTSLYNILGEMTSYTDSAGNTAAYEYETTGEYRLTHMNDGEGWQSYEYNNTTDERDELTDSAAKTFTATFDLEGRPLTETYPNGMTAHRTYNSVGTATGIEYKKETNCSEKCVWFSDTTTPSIHGETMQQTSTLSEEPAYTYDAAGRLTSAQEIPAGGDCKTRLYSYDESSDRTSFTQREPNSEDKCATEGGTTEWHTYTTAGRFTDPGVTYEPFGNATTLPATDAGGHELTSTYYVDGQVYTQTQDGTATEYRLDPAGRTRETIPNANAEEAETLHYDAPGTAVAWTSEANGSWKRNIPGLNGTLMATEAGTGTKGKAAVLELSDLNGNIVATAALSETATKLSTTYNSTEFGIPTATKPPEYSWLGADWITANPTTGTITEDGITYVPQIGSPLQTQPIEPINPAFEGTPYMSSISNAAVEGAIAAAGRASSRALEAFAAAAAAASAVQGGGGGGGGGGCTGIVATCLASHYDRSQKCELDVLVGGEHGKVWSRAWASCGGMKLPELAWASSCLTEESADGYAPTGQQWVGCSPAVFGSQYPYRLYSNYEHGCLSGVIFHGVGGVWIPGPTGLVSRETSNGWQCGESREAQTWNFVWFLVEALSDLHPEDG